MSLSMTSAEPKQVHNAPISRFAKWPLGVLDASLQSCKTKLTVAGVTTKVPPKRNVSPKESLLRGAA